ncbi:MAG: pyruvate kinase [Candidatus Micrarchaeia archaeon]
MNKTKIIVTYGPATENESILDELAKHADAIRINFSHTTIQQAKEIVERIRHAAKVADKEIGILADLPGPKIRLGELKADIEVRKGDLIKFSGPRDKLDAIKIDYANLEKELKEGETFSIGEGALKFKVKEAYKGTFVCKALSDGYLSSRKGVNFYESEISAEPPTKEDIRFAKFCKNSDFDFVAESFVKSPENIERLRKYAGDLPIIAKIERKKALDNIDAIVDAADAVMAARGDLAFEVSLESIPLAQRRILIAARRLGKPSIVATQVLASMVESEIPTRAEVNDIATAISEGADAILLTDETAIGKYPVQATMTLAETIRYAEKIKNNEFLPKIKSTMEYIAYAATDIANKYGLDGIFAPTRTGNTAKRLSMLRPDTEIIALSESRSVLRRLSICKGVKAMPITHYTTHEELLERVEQIAKSLGAKKYIIVYGSNKAGSTDTLKYVEAGNAKEKN